MPARACRGCLATGPRLYNIYENNLNELFGELVGNPISDADDLPQHFCGMCFAQLTKYVSFRNRCRLAQDILEDLKLQGMKLSTRFIKQIDRSKCNLVTNLEIVKPFHCDLLIQEEFSDEPRPETQVEPVSDNEIDPEFIDEVHESISQFSKTGASNWFTPVSSPGVDESLHEVDTKESIILSSSSKPEPTWLTPESQLAINRPNQALSSLKTEPTKNVVPKPKWIEENQTVHRIKYDDIEIIEEFKKKYNMDVTFLTTEQQIEEVKEKIRQSSTRRGGGPYCSYCGKSCLSETTLEKHINECHDKSADLGECQICRYRLPSYQFERHLQAHKIRILCRLCDFTTKNFGSAMNHARQHGVNGEPLKYSCKYCETVFEKREWLNSHIFRAHSNKLPWCKFCGETVLNKTGMRYHMRCHEDLVKCEYKCLQCSLIFVTSEALENHSSLTCEEYNCVMCGEHFESKMVLKEHLIQEHSRLEYIKLAHCEGCGVKFFGREPLEKHLEEETCGSGHPCQVCGLSFSTEKNLEVHKLEFHLKLYRVCETCDKAFDSKNYRQHISRVYNTEPTSISRGIHPHTSAKFWSVGDNVISGVAASATESGSDEQSKGILMCHVCGETFLKYVDLRIHMHEHTEEKPFCCDVCQKVYTSKEALQAHAAVHPAACPHAPCRKTFRRRGALARHVLCHTGIRRHICRVCGKKFRTSSGVKAHIKGAHMQVRVRTLETLRNEQDQMDSQGDMDAQGQVDTQDNMDGNVQEHIDGNVQEHIEGEILTQGHIDNEDGQNLMDSENTQNYTENEVTTQYYMDNEIETQGYMDSEVQTQSYIENEVQIQDYIDDKNNSVVKLIPVNMPGRQKIIRVETKDSDHTENYIDTHTQYYMDNGITKAGSDTFDIAVPRITKTIHIKRRRKKVTSNIPTQHSNENTHTQDYMDTHKQVYIDGVTGKQVYIDNEEQTQNHMDNDKNTQNYIENDTTNIYINNEENTYNHIDSEIQTQDYILTEETTSGVVEIPVNEPESQDIISEQDYIDMHTQDYMDNNIIQETVIGDYDTHNGDETTAAVQRITKTIHIRRRKKRMDSNPPTHNNTQDYMDTHTQDYLDSDITQVGLVQNQDNYTTNVMDTPVPRITKTIHIKHRKKRKVSNISTQ